MSSKVLRTQQNPHEGDAEDRKSFVQVLKPTQMTATVVVAFVINNATSTLMNMACSHTRPAPANQRVAPETCVTSYQHLGTATFSTLMMAVFADN